MDEGEVDCSRYSLGVIRHIAPCTPTSTSERATDAEKAQLSAPQSFMVPIVKKPVGLEPRIPPGKGTVPIAWCCSKTQSVCTGITYTTTQGLNASSDVQEEVHVPPVNIQDRQVVLSSDGDRE
jgi:hypothetical protein